jgi:hypothetical protein
VGFADARAEGPIVLVMATFLLAAAAIPLAIANGRSASSAHTTTHTVYPGSGAREDAANRDECGGVGAAGEGDR